MKKSKKRKGFTLIELIAVIAILGILALIIVPRVTGYTKQAQKVTNATNAHSIIDAINLYNASASDNKQIATDSTTIKMGDIANASADSAAFDTTLPSFTDLKNMLNKLAKTKNDIYSTEANTNKTVSDVDELTTTH